MRRSLPNNLFAINMIFSTILKNIIASPLTGYFLFYGNKNLSIMIITNHTNLTQKLPQNQTGCARRPQTIRRCAYRTGTGTGRSVRGAVRPGRSVRGAVRLVVYGRLAGTATRTQK